MTIIVEMEIDVNKIPLTDISEYDSNGRVALTDGQTFIVSRFDIYALEDRIAAHKAQQTGYPKLMTNAWLGGPVSLTWYIPPTEEEIAAIRARNEAPEARAAWQAHLDRIEMGKPRRSYITGRYKGGAA